MPNVPQSLLSRYASEACLFSQRSAKIVSFQVEISSLFATHTEVSAGHEAALAAPFTNYRFGAIGTFRSAAALFRAEDFFRTGLDF